MSDSPPSCPRCHRLITWLDKAVDRQHAAEEMAREIREQALQDRANRADLEQRMLNCLTGEILAWMYAHHLEHKLREIHDQYGLPRDPELLELD